VNNSAISEIFLTFVASKIIFKGGDGSDCPGTPGFEDFPPFHLTVFYP